MPSPQYWQPQKINKYLLANNVNSFLTMPKTKSKTAAAKVHYNPPVLTVKCAVEVDAARKYHTIDFASISTQKRQNPPGCFDYDSDDEPETTFREHQWIALWWSDLVKWRTGYIVVGGNKKCKARFHAGNWEEGKCCYHQLTLENMDEKKFKADDFRIRKDLFIGQICYDTDAESHDYLTTGFCSIVDVHPVTGGVFVIWEDTDPDTPNPSRKKLTNPNKMYLISADSLVGLSKEEEPNSVSSVASSSSEDQDSSSSGDDIKLNDRTANATERCNPMRQAKSWYYEVASTSSSSSSPSDEDRKQPAQKKACTQPSPTHSSDDSSSDEDRKQPAQENACTQPSPTHSSDDSSSDDSSEDTSNDKSSDDIVTTRTTTYKDQKEHIKQDECEEDGDETGSEEGGTEEGLGEEELAPSEDDDDETPIPPPGNIRLPPAVYSSSSNEDGEEERNDLDEEDSHKSKEGSKEEEKDEAKETNQEVVVQEETIESFEELFGVSHDTYRNEVDDGGNADDGDVLSV